jgi:hypothetical protein
MGRESFKQFTTHPSRVGESAKFRQPQLFIRTHTVDFKKAGEVDIVNGERASDPNTTPWGKGFYAFMR